MSPFDFQLRSGGRSPVLATIGLNYEAAYVEPRCIAFV
jgi:hypothetical protein